MSESNVVSRLVKRVVKSVAGRVILATTAIAAPLHADGFEITGAKNLLDQLQSTLLGPIIKGICVVALIIIGILFIVNKDSQSTKKSLIFWGGGVLLVLSAATIADAVWKAGGGAA